MHVLLLAREWPEGSSSRRVSCSAMDDQYEALCMLNSNSAQHGTWLVRVHDPIVVQYKFNTKKGDPVTAKRFKCVLVGTDPKQYCVGAINFNFKTPQAAEAAALRFLHNTAWKLSKVTMVTGNDCNYLSCKVKVIVDLATTEHEL